MSHRQNQQTMLIVESDYIMAQRMIALLSKHFSAIRIIGVANTARDALTLAAAERPDFILTELSDLGMTGRDFLKQLEVLAPEVSWLIISSLDYPELVATAFRGGAIDYLIKPVSDPALLSALERAVLLHRNQRRLASLQSRYDAYRLMAKPLLAQLLLAEICKPWEVCDQNELPPVREFLTLLDRESLLAQPSLTFSCLVMTVSSDISALEASSFGRVQDLLQSLCDCVCSPLLLGRMTALLFSIPGKPSPAEVAEALRLRIRTAGGEVSIGLGRQSPTLAGCRQSYLDAIAVCSPMPPWEKSDDLVQTRPALQEMLRLIEAQQLPEAKAVFDRLCEPWVLDPQVPISFAVDRMLWVTLETAVLRGIPHQHIGPLLLCLARVSDHPALLRCAWDAFALFARPHHQQESSLVQQVDDYLKAHYADPISLQEVADHVNLTPYYLSRRYKQDTGIPFHEKLTAIRIDHAKRLLRNHPHSIKEVALLVGYHEPAYFSKVFTRLVGVSPAAYKKQIAPA